MSRQETLAKRFTFRSTVILTAILTVVFSFMYFNTVKDITTLVEREKTLIQDSYQSKGTLLTDLASKMLVGPMMISDMYTMKTIATELLKDSDVIRVEIFDDKDELIMVEEEEARSDSLLILTAEVITDPEQYTIEMLKGKLQLSIDKYQLLQKQEELAAFQKSKKISLILFFIVLTIVVNILIAITINIILKKIVISPIKKGIELVTAVAEEGDISVNVSQKFSNTVLTSEISHLAEAMEKLVAAEQEVVQLTSSLAKGDWTQVMHERSEADSLAHALQDMVSNVNQTLLTVKMMSEQVNEVSQQLSDSGQSLAHGASEQAQNIDTITSAISELAAQTEMSANNVKNARQYAIEVNDNAKAGNDQMELLNDAMAHIQESSDSIQKIIKTIDDIAFQTNLLALNAAVEAARAGQHGKGFAVVADEVRNLASRSAKAAQETANLIEDSNNKVKNGLHIASLTDESLKEIVAGVGQINASLEEIASASTKEVTDIDSIKTNLLTIENITQQNSATSEETAAMAEELSTQSSSLMEMISAFRLAGNETSTNSDEEDDYLSPPQLNYN